MKLKQLTVPWLLLLTSCGALEEGKVKPPLVYRIDIQQGNVVDQEMIAKLRVGMDEKQVKFIMGTPLLVDPFHPERWEYLFSYQQGGKHRQQRHVTLYFDRDKKLQGISGDITVTHLPITIEENKTEKSVVVPENFNKDTLFEKLMPHWGKKKRNVKNDIDKTKEKTENAQMAEDMNESIPEPELEAVVEKNEPQNHILEKTQAEETQLPQELITEQEQAEKDNNTEEISNNSESEKEKPGFFSRMWDEITREEQP